MTVGELVYKQAVEQGYSPNLVKGLVPSLNNALESYRKLSETMQEPMRRAAEVAHSMSETLKPQMEAMSRLSKISFPEMPTLPAIPSHFYDEEDELVLPALTRPVQDVRIVNAEDFVAASAEQKVQVVTASYILPENAVWEALLIKFLDGHIVRVSYPGMETKKFDFKDMGFLNGKTMRPDMKWALLYAIADNDGALTKDRWSRKFGRNVKYELNKKLMNFFGMDNPPIPHYTKQRGYQPLFTVKPDR